MKKLLSLAAIAVFLFVLLSGCTSKPSTNDYPSIDIQPPADDTETISTDTSLGTDLAPVDDYSNSMDSDLVNLQDNSEPGSDMGLGGI